MSVAKVIEISSESQTSFEDAIEQGIKNAAKSVDNIQSAWIKEQKVTVDKDRITHYRADMKVTFILN